MSLKIIIVPLLVLTIIVFSIWLLVPAYQEMKNSIAKLDEAEANIENIEQKTQIAERLSQELSQDIETQDIIAGYIPFEKKEEDIFNNLNDIAYTQGMAVYNISLGKESSVPSAPSVPAAMDPFSGLPMPAAETIPVIRNVQASLGAVGDYDKIKGFLRKLANLKRYNNIASIKILKNKASTTGGEQAGASSLDNGILKMEVLASFNYLEKVKNAIDIDNKIFVTGQFDLSAADSIKKNKDTIVPDINIGAGAQTGKANPFIP